jgi:hypothetical protein
VDEVTNGPRSMDELRLIPLVSASARASAARRVISSITESIAVDLGGSSTSSMFVEPVDAVKVPGIVNVKAFDPVVHAAPLTGEPKTNGSVVDAASATSDGRDGRETGRRSAMSESADGGLAVLRSSV